MLWLLMAFIFAVAGCRSSAPVYHISQDIDFSYYKRVAVMPFDNLTSDRYAGEIVRQVAVSELLASGLVDVAYPGDVTHAVEDMGLAAGSTLTSEQIRALAEVLKVEALIVGSVEEYGSVKVGNVTAPQVTLTLMMADAGTGSIVWSVTQSRGGASFMARHFGARHETISETVLLVVREAVQTLALQ
jgi:hypothetical protein